MSDSRTGYACILYKRFADESTLYIIDDYSARKGLTKKKDMVPELPFNGRYAEQGISVLSQKYNSILTDFPEQIKGLAFLHCKDRILMTTACVRLMLYVHERQERLLKHCYQRASVRKSCLKLIILLLTKEFKRELIVLTNCLVCVVSKVCLQCSFL